MGRRHEDLAQRLWPETLQELQDTLSRSVGLPVLFVDPSGRPLAACEELSDFCRHFTRAIPISRPCLECGQEEASQKVSQAEAGAMRLRPLLRVCPLGLVDVIVPVFSAGATIGYLLSAQVRSEGQGEATSPAGRREAEEHVALLSRLHRRSDVEMERVGAGLSVVSWLVGALAAARKRSLRLSERIREQSRWIQEHLVTDAVTGVANGRRFRAALEAEILRARRYKRSLSLAVLDIERFRSINDEFGHEAGDAVLRAVAQCLASTIRQTDLVGRVGGDEFAVVFPETARPEAMIALARVNAQIDDLNASGELPVEVRLSVALLEHDGEAEDLLRVAREEARQARELGDLVRLD